jgi:hypothetical protein
MGTMHREVQVEWRPVWWERATQAMLADAVQRIGAYPASHIEVTTTGFRFTLAVHPLDNLAVHDPRLANLRREVEGLGG